MKVRLNTTYASPSGKTGQPGQLIDVSDQEGKDLLAGNYATAAAPAGQSESTETAEGAPAPENAAGRGGKKPAAGRKAPPVPPPDQLPRI